jgi:hypothetical protein
MCMKKLPFCKINVRLYLYIYIYPISTKNFYKRHLYVLKGLDVGTKLIWPYAANKEESDRYCWQQSPSVTWHYLPIRAMFTSHANLKYFLFHPSHRIFKRMHGALNVDKKTN